MAGATTSAATPAPAPARVVIVGAGFAGLACARGLARGWRERCTASSSSSPSNHRSLEILLLEAGDAVGGRARAATLPRTGAVELGPTWLHGVEPRNAAYGFYLEEQGRDPEALPPLSDQQQRWKMELLRPGQSAPLSGRERGDAIAAMAAFGDAIDHAEELVGGDGAGLEDATVGDALRKRFDELLLEEKGADATATEQQQKQQLLAEAWACRERLHRAYDGFRASDDAALSFARDYVELEGPHLPVPGGGFSRLASRLLRAAEREAESGGSGGDGGEEEGAVVSLSVRLGCAVERIEWGEDAEGAEAEGERRRPRAARVVLEPNGAGGDEAAATSIDADAVVVTVSLGVLQARAMAGRCSSGGKGGSGDDSSPPPRPLFSPPLPEPKQEALRRMRIGVIDKIFFEWDAAEEKGQEGEESGDGGQEEQQQQQQQQREGDDGQGGRDTQSQPFPMVCHDDDDDEDKVNHDDTVGPRKTHKASASAPAPAAAAAAAATSWCFLWPAAEPASWGSAARPLASSRPPFSVGAAASARELARRWMDADEAVFGAGGDDESGVPRWLRGLHSLRFSDGPEWCRGTDDDASVSRARSEGAACVVWATSAAALHSETLTDSELLETAWPALARAFPALEEKAVPKKARKGRAPPTSVARSRWGTDPRFHGSYSYPGPGATGGEADALAEPLRAGQGGGGRPAVCFAGEHTSRSYMGTVHGAMCTGEREAKRLLDEVLF